MKAVAIIQARMGSTRLPGKVMMDLAGEPMLARVVNRSRRATTLHEVVVRITADCPLIDPSAVDCVVLEFMRRQPEVAYGSNVFPSRTFPRGLDTEVMQFAALARAWKEDANLAWREQ
jgi:spore coat polysaccharide biosynthesis protein SpsF (cytidylyltransferase family)